ncbi:MAG: type II toxin-antitoxin system PemK/MazF family toxin [Chlorobium sp.]|nr:MAG: type II toxin-antitoxin system PemK/MazF family toxin [Chlorobium sp.]
MKNREIWLINLEPTIGAEIKKTRPAIIVSNNEIGILPLKIIVPITDWKEQYSHAQWMIKLSPDKHNALQKVSAADTFQVRSISRERFIKQLGVVDEITMQLIKQGLGCVLDIK